MPPDDDPREDGTGPHYADAADRLERVIDVQTERLHGIDDKAEHVTRLVCVLLGIALSVLSLAVKFGWTGPTTVMPVAALAFGTGVICLLASLGGAIVTYLNSRVRIGLDENVGLLLSTEQYAISTDEYEKRLLGAYGHEIRQNKRVRRTNVLRFRRTLVLLLVGVVYLTLSAVLSIGATASVAARPVAVAPDDARALFLWTTLLVLLVTAYVLSGRYLTLESQNANNE